ncbi:lipopolysaccharide biosynthesis protein [Bacterioplanoides sp.]|uniref:lipopolysaccharide biosynthesis protein n=1 Tax=Bacterioplanoides sp. TaxID=2066072 RepID=UPI003AFF93D1
MKTDTADKQTSGVVSQALYYGIGIVLMKGVSLLMMPYLTRQLTPMEYGLLEALVVLADIGTIVMGFGLVEALYRFVGEADTRQRETIVASCTGLTLVITLLAVLLLAVFQSQLLALLPLGIGQLELWLIAVPTLAEGLIVIPLTLMRMQSMAKQFCIYNVIKVLLQASLIVLLLESDSDAYSNIQAVLIAGAIASTMLVCLLIRYLLRQSGGFSQIVSLNRTVVGQLSRYGGPIVLSRMGLFAITGLDRWLLADRVGVEQLAVYAIASKFALILGLMMQPFALWWFPARFQLLQQDNGPQRCADFALLGTNIGIFLGAAMVLTLPAFVLLVLPQSYHAAASIVVWLALVNVLKNAGDLLNLGCFAGNSSQSQMWIQWACAAVAITGYWWLVPVYGVWGAVWVLLLVYGLRLLSFYIVSQYLLPLPYQHRRWVLSVLIAGLLVAGHQGLTNDWNDVAQLATGLSLSLLMLVLMFVARVFPLAFISELRRKTDYATSNL